MNFLTKMLIRKQLKGKMPETDMDKMIELIEKNPDYFKQLASSIEQKMKQGMSQEEATMAVMRQDGEELKRMLNK